MARPPCTCTHPYLEHKGCCGRYTCTLCDCQRYQRTPQPDTAWAGSPSPS